MRLAALLLGLAGCATTQAVRYNEYYAGNAIYYRYGHDRAGADTWYVADNNDPTRTVAALHDVESMDKIWTERTDRGDTLFGVPLVTARGEKLTQLYIQRGQGNRDMPEYPWVPVSPPLKRAVEFHVSDRVVAHAIPSGAAEPGLYLPITRNGTLAWFPDGVIGAQPGYDGSSVREDDFGFWLVRWGGVTPGWSVSLRSDLKDVPTSGPQWVSTEQVGLYNWRETPYDPAPDARILLGTRADGSCDAVVVIQSTTYDDVWPPPVHGATCKQAQTSMQGVVREVRNGGYEAQRQALARWEQEAQERGAQAQALLDQQITASLDHEASDVEAYERALTGQRDTPAQACEVISRVRSATHLDLLDRREQAGTLLPGEIACARRRAYRDASIASRLDAIERRKRQRYEATQQAAVGAAPAASHDTAADERARLYKATVDYTYGNSGVCPLATGLCR